MDSPFPGLRSFRVNEADWFFGRDGMSDAMALKLAKRRFLAVIGESGCGKSSLVRAGLLPTLQGGLLAEAGSRWRILDMHPGGDPLGALSAGLKKLGFLQGTDHETLERDPGALIAARKLTPGPENLLILVDQFEELFRFQAHRDEKAAFLQLLQEAVRQKETAIYVIITMRSDFIGLCSQFRGLPEEINEGQYLVPRMTRESLRQTIEGPVRLAGAEIESRLVQTLLNEVGSEPDQLPVLQHALMRTWNNWVDRNNPDDPVREDPDYLKTGRLQNALSNHADEALAAAAVSLGPETERIAQQAFLLLRDRDVNGQEVRRPTKVQEICEVTGAAPAQIRILLEEFRKPGRTFVSASPDQFDEEAFAKVEYDVTHESFIRKWTRLRDQWLPAELNSRRIYVRLAQQALDSDSLNPSYMDGAVLDQTLDWANPPSGSSCPKPTADWARRYRYDFGDAGVDGLFEKAMAFLRASSDARDARRASAEEARQAEFKALKASAKKRLAYVASGVLLAGLIIAILVARHATHQSEHATALTIASSALLASQDPWQATRSALLSGESLRRENSLLAAAVLSRSLSLLPKPLPSLHHQGAAFVSYSPDASRLATADRNGLIQLWNVADPKTPQTLRCDRQIRAFALLAAHALILSDAGGLELLPLDGAEIKPLCPDPGRFAVSANGEHIAAHCGDSLLLADVAPGKVTSRSIPPEADVSQDLDPDFLAVSNSGNWVASATEGTGVNLFPVAGKHLPGPLHFGDLAALAFTGDDQAVVVRQDGIVRRWNPADPAAGAEDYPLEGFGKGDRYHTVVAGTRGNLVVQSNAQGVFAWSISGEQLAVADLARPVVSMAATGAELAALDSAGRVKRWTLPPLIEPPFKGKIAFFSPDGNWLMQRDDVLNYRLTSTLTRSNQSANATSSGNYPVAFRSADNAVAVRVNQSASPSRTLFSGLELRSFANGQIGSQPLIRPIRDVGTLSSVAFSPDGSSLLTVNRSGARGSVVSLWDMKTGQAIGQQPVSRIVGVFFASDSQTVFWDDGEKLVAWKPRKPTLAQVPLPGGESRFLWAAASKTGVAACALSSVPATAQPGDSDVTSEAAREGQTLAVWRYPGWNQAVRMDNDGPISHLVFSSDGKLLVSSTADGILRIWDWERRTQLATIPTHAPVSALAYRDDHRIVVLHAGRLRTYLWRDSDLHDALCRSAGRELTLAEWKGAQLQQTDFPKKKLCPAPSENVKE